MTHNTREVEEVRDVFDDSLYHGHEVKTILHHQLQKAREERDAQWRKHLETCKIEVDFVDGKPRAKIDPLPHSELDQDNK